jgi:dTDP-4-dehydrorhamnose 3,5-epimerase
VIFTETDVAGSFVIDLERRGDERGFFARSWCAAEFEAVGLNPEVAQINVGCSQKKGTLRGMHYQHAPYGEVKIVRCTRGAVFDVVLDLRPESATHRRWWGTELTAENRRMLYVPEGCAHGYQTLEDDCEITYLASVPFAPDHARGVRYDDPAFGILWPLAVSVISDQDRTWPLCPPWAPPA